MTCLSLGPRLNILNIWVAKSVQRWAFESNLILLKLLILLLRSHLQIVNSLLNWTVSQMKNSNRWVKVCTLTSGFQHLIISCKILWTCDQFLCIIIRCRERDTRAQYCQWWKIEFKSILYVLNLYNKRLVVYSHYVLGQSWWVCNELCCGPGAAYGTVLPLHDHELTDSLHLLTGSKVTFKTPKDWNSLGKAINLM